MDAVNNVLIVLAAGTSGLGKKRVLRDFGNWVEAYFSAHPEVGKEPGTSSMRRFRVLVQEPYLGGVRNLLDSTLNVEARRARIRTALSGARVAIKEATEKELLGVPHDDYLVCFVPVHLVGYRHGEFTLLYTPGEFDDCLGPVDLIVTLIDNVYDLWARMVKNEVDEPQHTYVSLRETSQWRSAEIMMADFLAEHFTAWKKTWLKRTHSLPESSEDRRKLLSGILPDHISRWLGQDAWDRESRGDLLAPWEVRNYVLAVSHPRITLFRLIQRAIIAKSAKENKKPAAESRIQDYDKTPGPIYASYPISDTRKFDKDKGGGTAAEAREGKIEKVNQYRKALHTKLVVFDPVTIGSV